MKNVFRKVVDWKAWKWGYWCVISLISLVIFVTIWDVISDMKIEGYRDRINTILIPIGILFFPCFFSLFLKKGYFEKVSFILLLIVIAVISYRLFYG
jgi:hypothetical protein